MAVDQEHTIWALCGITLFGNSRLGTLVHRGRHPVELPQPSGHNVYQGDIGVSTPASGGNPATRQPCSGNASRDGVAMASGGRLARGEGVLQRKVVAAPFGDDQQLAAGT